MSKRYCGWRRRRKIRLRLLAESPTCFYCGYSLVIDYSSLDHVVAKSKGGNDAESNLVLCCHVCNKRKADGPIEGIAVGVHRGYGLLSHLDVTRINAKARRRIARRKQHAARAEAEPAAVACGDSSQK